MKSKSQTNMLRCLAWPRRRSLQRAATCRLTGFSITKPAFLACRSERLPDGATFRPVYETATCFWTATLTVDGQVFHAKSHGVFGCMGRLDQFYRKWLATEKAKA